MGGQDLPITVERATSAQIRLNGNKAPKSHDCWRDFTEIARSADPELQRAIDSLIAPGVLVGHRLICPSDDLALLEEESLSISARVLSQRRASGACRIVGRELLRRLGHVGCAIAKNPSGSPRWPAGIAGSLAHDESVAVAAVGRRRDVSTVGIDVEPAKPLPDGLLKLISSPLERSKLDDDPLQGLMLFAAKEAVYKAAYPLDHMFLDYSDIQVDLANGEACVQNRRVVRVQVCATSHVVALATSK